MRAVIITRPGDVDVLAVGDVPVREPGPREVRRRRPRRIGSWTRAACAGGR
jgi:NADPH:quinone reductase-like Zn-dependent oxidoreductase